MTRLLAGLVIALAGLAILLRSTPATANGTLLLASFLVAIGCVILAAQAFAPDDSRKRQRETDKKIRAGVDAARRKHTSRDQDQ